MLVIFVFELALAIYTLVRYKLKPKSRLIAAMLFLLAIFQLSEFHVCRQSGDSSLIWTRIGYLAITMLPALGLHLVFIIANKKSRVLVWAVYAVALCFALIFGLSSSAFISHICTGNYAIFDLHKPLAGYYFVYYYALLFLGIGLSFYYSISANLKVRKALILQIIGYLSFLLPTGLINSMNPQTVAGRPSIMCGFAVIYAIILAFGILPIIQTNNKNKK